LSVTRYEFDEYALRTLAYDSIMTATFTCVIDLKQLATLNVTLHNKRLFFLRRLKRAALSSDDLVTYYRAVMRPVAEYACAVWHSIITEGQSEQLEQLHTRAIIIFYFFLFFIIIFGRKLDHDTAWFIYDREPTLASR
jgi:hypothetical protein